MAENYSNFWITLFYSSSPSLPLLIPTNHNWYLFFYTSNFIKNISTGFLIGEWGYFGNFTYDWERECVWERASTMVLLLWREGGADWVFEYEDLVLTQIWVIQIEKEHRVGLWLKRKTKPKTSWVYKKQWLSLSLSLSLTQFLGLGFISFFFNGVFNLLPISNYPSSSFSCWVFREAQFGFYFLQSIFLWTQNDSVLPETKSEERGVESSERESGWDWFGDDEFGDGRRVR